MVKVNTMDNTSEFKGIKLIKIVEIIYILNKNNKMSSMTSIDFGLDDKGNLKDNSFVTTTTLEGWFIIEKYCLSTNTTNTNSGFAVFLDKNDCLHIDNYANII